MTQKPPYSRLRLALSICAFEIGFLSYYVGRELFIAWDASDPVCAAIAMVLAVMDAALVILNFWLAGKIARRLKFILETERLFDDYDRCHPVFGFNRRESILEQLEAHARDVNSL